MVIHGLLALIIGIGAFVTVAGFLLILYAAIVVTVCSRQEEKHRTFLRHRAPSGTAEQARLIAGRYVRQEVPEVAAEIPEEALPWYERSQGPRS